jgi:hypothetical protein
MENDLAIAFGGYTMMSVIRVRSGPIHDGRREVQILSWRVQLCDQYDFNFRNRIALPISPDVIPTERLRAVGEAFRGEGVSVREGFLGLDPNYVTMDDDWFRAIAASGGATNYDLYSEEFDAPASVTSSFYM